MECVACDLCENELCHLIFGFVAGTAGVDDLWLLIVALLHVFAQDFAQGTVVLVPHVSMLHHCRPDHTQNLPQMQSSYFQKYGFILFSAVLLE